MLGQRIVTAVILIVLLLAALIWLPQTAWTLLVAALVLVAAYEWARLSGYSRNATLIYLALTLIVFWLALSYQSTDEYWHGLPIYLIAALFWFVLAPLWLAKGYQNRDTVSMAITGWVVIVPTGLAMP